MPLITEGSQTCIVGSVCADTAKNELEGQSLQWKPRYSQKYTMFSMVNVHSDRSQPN